MTARPLSWRLLQAKYALRWGWELPGCYLAWVVRSRDPLHRKMFWERLGLLPSVPGEPGKRILIDTNGHGEYNQIHTFVRLLRQRYPDWTVLLMSWNPEIVELASANPDLEAAYFAPWDIGVLARRFLRTLAPGLFIAVDQVRLPCFLKAAKALKVRTILVSASLTEAYLDSVHLKKALAYRFHRYFDRICVAGDADLDNFLRIGCDPSKLVVSGYMKFDLAYLQTTDEERQAMKASLGLGDAKAVWVAGSIRPGEEHVVLEAYQQVVRHVPGVRLVVAPRYLTQVEQICQAARVRGLSYELKTQRNGHPSSEAVMVLDTYGELSKLYAIADVVFIGNSLLPADRYALGQNLIEPLAHRKPVCFGPFMNKWKPITAALKTAWPELEVRDSRELASSVACLLQQPNVAARVTQAVEEILERNRTAVERNFEETVRVLERTHVRN